MTEWAGLGQVCLRGVGSAATLRLRPLRRSAGAARRNADSRQTGDADETVLWLGRGCGVSGALASTSVFTDESSFLAQLDGPALNEDFGGLAAGLAAGPFVFSDNGFTATATSVASAIDGPGGTQEFFNDPGLLTLNSATDAIRFDFSPNTTAVGGVFLATDINFFAVPGVDVIVELNDGTTETITTVTGDEFVGFVNLAGISSIVIDAPDVLDPIFGGTTPIWPAADQLIAGAAIPAPGAAALLGLAGVAGLRRRR